MKTAKNQGILSEKDYYVGFDIGTDSVGYAVTDENYHLLKHRGEPMWGSHLFDEAVGCEERRAFRTARRRLDRRQQRVRFIREIFAKEIQTIDEHFYKRLDMSALCAEDKTLPSPNSFFNDVNYTDKDYHVEYPTIHHLICDLMYSEKPHDVRLVYLAIAYLVAHRGHFLSEAPEDNIEAVLDFEPLYRDFVNYFDVAPWSCDVNALKNILKKKLGISKKEKELITLIFGGKKPKPDEEDLVDKALLLKLLAGGSVSPNKLFLKADYAEIKSVSLDMDDDKFSEILGELNDDGELLVLMRKIYDWSLLSDICPDSQTMVSDVKVQVYDRHKKDLAFLKYFVRKYLGKQKYFEVFRSENNKENYVAYSKNEKSLPNGKRMDKSANKETFCAYILKLVKDVAVEECDKEKYEDMLYRLGKDILTFMPKQVEGNNRVIPYQLYLAELKKILNRACAYLPFLLESDNEGLTPCQKIVSVFKFRVPYFVGPLNDRSSYAWIVRKAGRITPWQFDSMVDLNASEQAFIDRMTNNCTYCPGESVLPKYSLLYMKFNVLNEINMLRINGNPISVDTKQSIFNDLFMQKSKITRKAIEDYLRAKGLIQKGDTVKGVDDTIKSALTSYHFFKPYIEAKLLTEKDAERIIERKAYSEDRLRLIKWLQAEYPSLSKENAKRIASQNFKEFGRLSKMFLAGIDGTNKETGEHYSSIIDALWETNCNIMQLISGDFTFIDSISEMSVEYYAEHCLSLAERMADMYVPNAVKRPIIRTFDILSDIVRVNKGCPKKIFIEMARGAGDDQKNKRTVSRKEKILEFYKAFEKSDEIERLKKQLETKDDRELKGEALYLYFMQLGKSMYSGTPIDISALGTGRYNIDHIYPQSMIKDDSITNKVLVLSEENSDKGDIYPIKSEIRAKMSTVWKSLFDRGLISQEKLYRLTRREEITPDERWGFINRQLVETRQSTKAVATLLKELYPQTEVVYVKAGLAADFRQENNALKSRVVNDLHHAKDAYLNIAIGNLYHTVFTKKWFIDHEKESTNYKVIYPRKWTSGGKMIWNGMETKNYVLKMLSKNNIHLTRYSYCVQGGFFDQMPLKADNSPLLIPRKKALPTAQYGGYAKTSVAFYVLVKYKSKKSAEVMLLPIEVMYAKQFLGDSAFAEQYLIDSVEKIISTRPEKVDLPLGMRIIRINSVIEIDGFKYILCGKSSGGTQLIVASHESLKLDTSLEQYVKYLESFSEKLKKDPSAKPGDRISSTENSNLYELLSQKIQGDFYGKTYLSSVKETIVKGKDKFEGLSLEKQVLLLLNLLLVFKSSRKGTVDLSLIGGTSKQGSVLVSSKLSNWAKGHAHAYLVDQSASGLFTCKSVDLFTLL